MAPLAYLFVILKCIIYGSSVFFTGALTETVDVLDVLSLRFLMSFVVLWLLKTFKVLKIEVGVKDFFKGGERAPFIKTLLLAALFEPVLYMLFETLGISMSSDITTAVILSLAAVFSCILETLILKEKSTLLQKIFLGLGIVGVIYIAVNSTAAGGEDSFLGIFFLFLALITTALFMVFSRKSSSHFSSMEITYVSCLLGAFIFNAVNVVRHLFRGDILNYFDPYFNAENIIGFVFLAVFCTIIATVMSNYALANMQVSTFSAFGGLSTLVTIAIGVIFAGEELKYFHFIGLSLIIIRMVGVSAIAIKRDKEKAMRAALDKAVESAEREAVSES